MTRFLAVGTMLLLIASAPAAFAQANKNEGATRSVEGAVTTAEDTSAVGAVVQLKNVKTLQIRSFITKEDGQYHFFELSPDVDYELKADFQGASSGAKTLSSFDSRKKATINLKLAKKVKPPGGNWVAASVFRGRRSSRISCLSDLLQSLAYSLLHAAAGGEIVLRSRE